MADPVVFGTDLYFNGNLVVGAKGDYAEVSDEENLRRSIIRRLITDPGTYKYIPTYGVGLYSQIKKPMTKSRIDQLRHRIIDQVSRDRRVDKVVSLDLTVTTFNNQPGLSITLIVQAKGKKVSFQPFNFARSL